MFDAAPPDRRANDMFLMRALVIAQDPEVIVSWRRALADRRIEQVKAANVLEAIRFGTPVGFDLIVITACPGEISPVEFIALVNRGLFGAVPPPVIVELRDFGSILEARDGAFAGCVIVASRDGEDRARLIDQAFSFIETRGSGTGDSDA
jgi:hypothetical protein